MSLPFVTGPGTALQARPAARAGASSEVSAGAATRTAAACEAVTARSGDSRGCGSGAGWVRRGGVDGRDLSPGTFASPAALRGLGPLRDSAAVLRVAPAPLRRTRGGPSVFIIGIFYSELVWGSCCWERGGDGGGERGGPGAGILTDQLRKMEVASRNPTCPVS